LCPECGEELERVTVWCGMHEDGLGCSTASFRDGRFELYRMDGSRDVTYIGCKKCKHRIPVSEISAIIKHVKLVLEDVI